MYQFYSLIWFYKYPRCFSKRLLNSSIEYNKDDIWCDWRLKYLFLILLRLGFTSICFCLFVCFVALRPKSTAMVIAGRSVHLTTLFPGQA